LRDQRVRPIVVAQDTPDRHQQDAECGCATNTDR
jgi:hypothetical protein